MITIFLADDHGLVREGLKQILARQHDMTVAGEASNGVEALDWLRHHTCDVVLLDISMPGRSGAEVLADIRRELPEVNVLVLSMHPEDQYAVRVMRAGAAGYVTKDSASETLLAAIRKVAAGGKYVSPSLAESLAFAIEKGLDPPGHTQLSNREFQVLRMLASGKAPRAIADELMISEKTVATYRARILEKLDLHNTVELTRYALEHKLID